MRLKPRLRTVLLAGMLSVLAAEDARAVLSFPAPQAASTDGQPFSQRVAMAPDGTAVVAWQEVGVGEARIKLRRVAPDGSMEPIRNASPSGDQASRPQVVASSDGTATVVWINDDGVDDPTVMVRRLGADNTFDGPAQALSDPSEEANDLSIAIDALNRVTIAWSLNADVEATRMSAAGVPGATIDVASTGSFEDDVYVAMDFADRAMVLFTRSSEELIARRINANGSLESERTISAVGTDVSYDYALGFDSANLATIAWVAEPTGGGDGRMYTRTLDSGGTLGTTSPLGPATFEPRSPQVLVDSAGRARVVWSTFFSPTAGDFGLRYRRLDASGQPLGTGPLDLGHGVGAAAAIDDGDRIVVAYSDQTPDFDRTEVLRISAAGAPGPEKVVSPATQGTAAVALALDPAGAPVVAYYGIDLVAISDDTYVTRGVLAAPETSILSGPADGATTNDETLTFTMASTGEVGAGFECSVDSAAFAPCTSPLALSGLADGNHTFAVRASDEDGTDASPATRAFTVDTRLVGLKVKAKKKQRQKGRKLQIKVEVDAGEAADAEATGEIKIGGKKRPMVAGPRDVASQEGALLKLKLKRASDQRKALRELKKGKGLKAKLTVIVTDAAGNSASEKLKLRLVG